MVMDTNDHTDAHIDEALDALARPPVPSAHLTRVLARTAPSARDAGPAPAWLRPRWALPAAATVLAVIAATQWADGGDVTWPEARQSTAAGAEGAPAEPWGAPREIDSPVLPPQAYWGMDAFEEFATLRGDRLKAQGSGLKAQGSARDRVTQDRRTFAAVAYAWVPTSSGLPPIEVDPIEPAPIEVPALPELEAITPADITLAPIVIAPLTDQE
jgi:hypothetical protein